MKKVKLIIATHKKYLMPTDSIYYPLHVGAEGKEDLGYSKDNTGDNISNKNPYFCELTGLYWAWKNLKYDYIGLVHYRRHFTMKKRKYKSQKERIENILSSGEITNLLNKTDIILPKPRNYYIENLYDHYRHTMYVEPLDLTGKIIKEKYPNYYKEFLTLKKRKKAHMFNMFVMKKEIMSDYCEWLFNILFELEKEMNKLDIKYDSFHSRFYGRISELLLDVYINTNDLKYEEVKIMDIDNINWFVKGTSFLKAKFFGKKYGKSF